MFGSAGSLVRRFVVLAGILLAGAVVIPGIADGAMTGALAVALVVVASVPVLLVVVAMTPQPAGDRATPHPRRAIDASTLLSQSAPDAPGHPRPRAPQRVAPAA